MQHWLVNRLTASKQTSERWVQLAMSLELFWDQQFTPAIERVENSRSIFTASPKDLEKALADMGSFFDVFMPIAETNKPLAIAWRRDELHYKDTSLPVQSILARNFSGLNTRWEPLYAKDAESYQQGTFYSTDEVHDLGHALDDYFLTSRGRLWVDLGHLRLLQISRSEFETIVRQEIEKIRPTHIVYEGELFQLSIHFKAKPDRLLIETQKTERPAHLPYQDQFETPRLDWQTIRQRELTPLLQYNESPYFYFDDVPADYAPLDTYVENVNA
ncbi:hypothetical protein H0A36_27625 [Endozoicomonas sp. SM1973]|uniref:Uncharacterized protein n=1 Tax=Spartinivicinus marinus TaxID=2994442 RepID=A0A853IPG1_9GAMM|nr:hypothetical protein [Spartinivicinus marinus]MCX4030375.1 hypothetical protein [Spartinivicinus marinus]NYZ69786.1 hypothetical protein [Spartinivicinus marinus]